MLFVDIDLLPVYFYHNFNFDTIEKVSEVVDKRRDSVYNNIE